MYGPAAAKMVGAIVKNNPMILSNIVARMKNKDAWQRMMSSPRFVEVAMKDVEEHRLQARLATEYMKGIFPVRKAPTEKSPEVSLKWLFPEESKVQPEPVKPQPAEVNLGEFFRFVDREAAERPAPSKGSGYTLPKPRRKGEIIAQGFGGEAIGQLEKLYGAKLNRKRRGEG